MAAKINTTRSAPRKASAKAINAFMGKLLDPLPDAELEDREITRLEKRARKQEWTEGLYRARAADAYHQFISYTGNVERLKGKALDFSAEHKANDLRLAEFRRQILVPAPDAAALKWKKGLLGIMGILDDHREAVARDEARLEAERAAAPKRGRA